MSTMVIETVKGKTTGKVEGTFLYVKLQTGTYKYQSKNKEYTIDLVVDKATSKDFKKNFPKNRCKEYDNEEFVQKFKIDPPYPKQDEQFVIKIAADAYLKADSPKSGLNEGDDIPYSWSTRPKAFVPVEDGKVKDITLTTLVGNGSKGVVAFSVTKNDFGTFPQLAGILINELVEYEGGSETSCVFGSVLGGFNEDTSNVKQKAEAPKKEEHDDQEEGGSSDSPEEDHLEDDIPF